VSLDRARLSNRVRPDVLGNLLRSHDGNAQIDEVHESLAVLSRARVQRRDRQRLVLVLLSIAEDRGLHPMVRGGAAEAVSVWLSPTLRSLRRVSITRLIRLLSDDSADVRFWSSFSLGQLRATQARPALRRILTDRRVIDGWWAIGDEAEAALANLQRIVRPTIFARSGEQNEATRTYQYLEPIGRKEYEASIRLAPDNWAVSLVRLALYDAPGLHRDGVPTCIDRRRR
jgi:hypothetical protein